MLHVRGARCREFGYKSRLLQYGTTHSVAGLAVYHLSAIFEGKRENARMMEITFCRHLEVGVIMVSMMVFVVPILGTPEPGPALSDRESMYPEWGQRRELSGAAKEVLRMLRYGTGFDIPVMNVYGSSPKRSRFNQIGKEFLGKRTVNYEPEDKRMGSEFLGKRMGSEFLGKRMGSEFLGKRMGSEFLGKRMGSEFLGKRMGSEFLGKRSSGWDNTDTDYPNERMLYPSMINGSEFLGRRKRNANLTPQQLATLERA